MSAPAIAKGGIPQEQKKSIPTKKVGDYRADGFAREIKPTRLSIAKPEDTTFLTPLKRTTKEGASASEIKIEKNKKSISKSSVQKNKNNWFFKFAVQAGWIICFLLVLRLIFMDRGIIDYVAKEKFLKGKEQHLVLLKAENHKLTEDISELQNNKSYQKKLVREVLGFIASDEYLILFAKEKDLNSK